MDKITKIGVAIIACLFVATVAVSGCTVQNPVDQVQQAVSPNKALDYTKIFEQNLKNNLGKNETLQDSQVAANGTDGATIQISTVNKTSSGFNANGTQTTIALNVHKYATKDDATAAYKKMAFGYTQNNSMTTTVLKPGEKNAYAEVMGHNATGTKAAFKLTNFSFISASMNLILQQDEFVLWGTIDVAPASM